MNSIVLGVISTLHQNCISATPARIADELGEMISDTVQSLLDLEQQGFIYRTQTGAYSLTEEGLAALYHG